MAPSSGLIRGVAFDWMTLIRGGTNVTGFLPWLLHYTSVYIYYSSINLIKRLFYDKLYEV